jgi:hypothetical protein
VAHVPYKSNPLAVTDLIGGQLDFMFLDAPTAMPHLNGGKLRALAVSGPTRLSGTPAVPTVDEGGVKGFDVSYWFAVYGPPGLPPAVTKKLNEMFVKASDAPEVKTAARTQQRRGRHVHARGAGALPGRRIAEVGQGHQGGRDRAGMTPPGPPAPCASVAPRASGATARSARRSWWNTATSTCWCSTTWPS